MTKLGTFLVLGWRWFLGIYYKGFLQRGLHRRFKAWRKANGLKLMEGDSVLVVNVLPLVDMALAALP